MHKHKKKSVGKSKVEKQKKTFTTNQKWSPKVEKALFGEVKNRKTTKKKMISFRPRKKKMTRAVKINERMYIQDGSFFFLLLGESRLKHIHTHTQREKVRSWDKENNEKKKKLRKQTVTIKSKKKKKTLLV